MRPWQAATTAAVVLAGMVIGVAGVKTPAYTNPFDPSLFAEFRWRNVGPHAGGPTVAAAGIASQPHVFYIGAAHGGVWKTTDAGRTWHPIFDDQPTGSIGAIAVASSAPDVVYAGTDRGLFKSTDAGRTWTQLGSIDGWPISAIAVDPRDAGTLFLAGRGIFRSVDGGESFDRVLEGRGDVDAAGVEIDPGDSANVYASLPGPDGGLFKSTDGGTSWQPSTIGLADLQEQDADLVDIAIAPSNPARVYVVLRVRQRESLFRSNDAGGSWTLVNDDPAGGDEAGLRAIVVDPADANVVYAAGTTLWKSVDGGRSLAAWTNAPAAGRHHRFWINPTDPSIALLAGDRGAVVTLNGGETWSSRYNQPTTAFHQVATSSAFPYRICGSQTTGGAVCVASRGDSGRITVRDWVPVGPAGTGFVTPDPQNANVLFTGPGVARVDRETRQIRHVGPPLGPDLRTPDAAPIVFSRMERRAMFFGARALWKTTDDGRTWSEVSPALGQSADAAIRTVAPSYVDRSVIWTGTSDGLVHVTRDGGSTWTNVTPDELTAGTGISQLEASHFDRNTAYAAIASPPPGDRQPHLYRTRDGGRTWIRIADGLPKPGAIHVVREDAYRRGLLFAGSDSAVHVSFDDGDSWQSLRLNMPATPVLDLTIRDADLVAATGGRGFWILDDFSPLRQITPDVAGAEAYLFRPPVGWRIRSRPDAAWPADEPASPNPPDGVVFSYLMGPTATGPVALEIIEPITGNVIRRFASDEPEPLADGPGLHRVVWDLRYPEGMFVVPGTYQVRLQAGGRSYRQAVVVRLDSRVEISAADLTAQFELSKKLADAMRRLSGAQADLSARLEETAGDARARLERQLAAVTAAYQPLPRLFQMVQDADAAPAPTVEQAATAALERVREALLLGAPLR